MKHISPSNEPLFYLKQWKEKEKGMENIVKELSNEPMKKQPCGGVHRASWVCLSCAKIRITTQQKE